MIISGFDLERVLGLGVFAKECIYLRILGGYIRAYAIGDSYVVGYNNVCCSGVRDLVVVIPKGEIEGCSRLRYIKGVRFFGDRVSLTDGCTTISFVREERVVPIWGERCSRLYEVFVMHYRERLRYATDRYNIFTIKGGKFFLNGRFIEGVNIEEDISVAFDMPLRSFFSNIEEWVEVDGKVCFSLTIMVGPPRAYLRIDYMVYRMLAIGEVQEDNIW